ncbi:2Fe-2S iron-sulfur cluster-binding protein [Streptomyces sp. NPDC126497]|uniref:2Fe-2S iron-sulfur cluster-binding protein n=1 Tax=Streptomyces sp. NPDC126497 TaxID=3155313 RepID=UPI00333425F0
MTDDQHGQGTPPGGSRWDPLPQGDYDDGATAFVNLPEGGIDALLDSMQSPLAAPGHGYVPPQITVDPAAGAVTDPAAAGSWGVPGAPVDGARWHDPEAGAVPGDRFTYDPGAAGQWSFEERAAENPAPGHDVTGQWSIPVADGDLPDESGEFTTSSLVEQWGGTPPATLPGGAPAPWAPPQDIGRPWGPGVPGVPQEEDREWRDGGHGPAPDGREPGPGTRADDPAAAPRPAGADPHGGRPAPAAEPLPPAEPGSPEGEPADQDVHGGTPARDTAVPPAGEHAPERPDEDPRQAGVPQPFADEGYAEPRWPSAAETPGEAEDPTDPAAGYREHPHPGARDGSEPAPGTGEAPEDTEETQEGTGAAESLPPEPSAPAPDAEPATEPAADAGSPDTGTTPAASGAADDPRPPHDPPHDDHPLASYVLRVNGADRPVTDAWIGESLLYVLRERLGLAGAKDGCSQGECGACNVQVDGRLVASCLVPAVTAAGSEVRTVEGLAQDGRPSDVQRALARCGAVQCGFCVPGMAMTVHDLLEGNPAPTELETRQALCGNLCRCSGYRGVVNAVKEVVAEREAHAASDADDPDDTPDTPRIPHQAGPGAGGVNPSAFGGPGPDEQPHDHSHGPDGGQA